MRIAVLGSGGIGGYYGARLADAGQDVLFTREVRKEASMRLARTIGTILTVDGSVMAQ